MVIRCCRVAAMLIVGWLGWQIAALGLRTITATVAARRRLRRNPVSSRGRRRFARMQSPWQRLQYVAPDASWLEPIQLPLFDLPVPDSRPSSSAAPPTSSGVDTGRDDGRFITINVNGQQLRIVQTPSRSTQDSSADKKLS